MNSQSDFSPCLRLHADDNIVVARMDVSAGTVISGGTAGQAVEGFAVSEAIGLGHKVASTSIGAGDPIRKYGQVIGYATEPIASGEWVHTHNVEPGDLDLDYAFSSAVPDPLDPITGQTFQGYRRADGRAGTRNYLGIVSTVNCSATASKSVARAFDEVRITTSWPGRSRGLPSTPTLAVSWCWAWAAKPGRARSWSTTTAWCNWTFRERTRGGWNRFRW